MQDRLQTMGHFITGGFGGSGWDQAIPYLLLGRGSDLADGAERWVWIGSEVMVHGTLLLILALLTSPLLKRVAASARHLTWLCALGSFLLLPVATVTLPEWQIVPAPASTVGPSDPSSFIESGGRGEVDAAGREQSAGDSELGEVTSRGATAKPSMNNVLSNRPSSVEWLGIVWLFGCSAVLAIWGLGYVSLWRLGRKATPVEDTQWIDLLGEVKSQMGINRSVRLLKSLDRAMPMTWGVIRPRMLLPIRADEWGNERLRSVLKHELAHVRRFDSLTQGIANFVAALFWMNPFVWWARREMLRDSEEACDDAAVLAGQKAADYADDLLRVGAGYQGGIPSGVGVPMARGSNLGDRVTAIMRDEKRRLMTRRMGVIIASSFVVVVSVAAVVGCTPRPAPQSNSDTAGMNPILAASNECVNHLKQIGLASQMYADDNDGALPTTLKDLMPYLEGSGAFVCPSDPKTKAAPTKDAFDPEKHASYRLVAGADVDASEGETVVAKCPIHEHEAYTYGRVEKGIEVTVRGEKSQQTGPAAADQGEARESEAESLPPPIDGIEYVVRAGIDADAEPQAARRLLQRARRALESRLTELGVRSAVELLDDGRLLVKVPKLEGEELTMADVKRAITTTGHLEFRIVHPRSDEFLYGGTIPQGYEWMTLTRRRKDGSKVSREFIVKNEPEKGLTEQMLAGATSEIGRPSGRPEIRLELTPEGAKRFEEVTRENLKEQLAIVLNGVLQSAPTIQSVIPGGTAAITGNFDEGEAAALAVSLNHPISVPLTIVESRNVGEE